MPIRGPKKLYRLSWSGANCYPSKGCNYYSDYEFVKEKLSKLKRLGAKIHLESCDPEWEIMSV